MAGLCESGNEPGVNLLKRVLDKILYDVNKSDIPRKLLHWLFNDAVSTTRLFRVDEIGDSELIIGDMRPRIRHRLPCIHITVGENLGKNPTSLSCGMYSSGKKKTGPTLVADFRALFTPEHDRLHLRMHLKFDISKASKQYSNMQCTSNTYTYYLLAVPVRSAAPVRNKYKRYREYKFADGCVYPFDEQCPIFHCTEKNTCPIAKM
ncbi:hypothetical protein ANN_12667 [Periplaneta americana]|uniref:Uncharacterized protein n=1 Tax=Periplaneta americana TaxID=6978 RepID=A0ABQ8TJ69_PERAM|nr:hypothetical protein ANN_12667 [Periplaneta americana]